MAQELKVIADFYDFMLWLIQHTEKFPRHHRYSLGLAMDRISPQITQISQMRLGLNQSASICAICGQRSESADYADFAEERARP